MLNSWGLAFALYADFHSIFDDAGDAISTDVCAHISMYIYGTSTHIHMYVYDICAAHFTPIAKLIEICNRNLLILLRQRAQGIPNHEVQRRTVDHIEEEYYICKLQTCFAYRYSISGTVLLKLEEIP